MSRRRPYWLRVLIFEIGWYMPFLPLRLRKAMFRQIWESSPPGAIFLPERTAGRQADMTCPVCDREECKELRCLKNG